MAITRLNSLAIPAGTVEPADISYPLTNFSSTGIDDNAINTAITIDSTQNVTLSGNTLTFSDSGATITTSGVNNSFNGNTGNTGSVAIYGGPDYSTGSGVAVYGASHANQADKIRFFTSGFTERVVIDATGKVGIGTNGPLRNIHSQSSQQVNGLFETTNTRSYIGFIDSSSSNNTGQYGPLIGSAGDNFVIANGPTNVVHVTVTPTGNVGIGTDLPSSALEVAHSGTYGLTISSPGNIAGMRIIGDSDNNGSGRQEWEINVDAGPLTFNDNTSGSERMRIDSSGRVGIGTSTPNYSLDTANAIYSGLDSYTGPNYGDLPGFIYLNGDTGGTGIVSAYQSSQRYLLSSGTTVSQLITYNNTGFNINSNNTRLALGSSAGSGGGGAGVIEFQTGVLLDTRMTITSNGDVGIGTSNPEELLHVKGTIVAAPVLFSSNQDEPYLIAGTQNYTGANTDWGTYGIQHRVKTNSGGTPRITVDTVNGEAFSIDNGGQVNIPIGGIQDVGSITSRGVFRGTSTTGSGTPTFSFDSDQDTGIYHVSTNILGVTTGGSVALAINDVNRVESYAAGGNATLRNVQQQTVANNGTVDFPLFSGMIIVNSISAGAAGGDAAIWMVGSGSATRIGSSTGITIGSMAYNSGVAGYRFTNNTGISRVFSFMAFDTRGTA